MVGKHVRSLRIAWRAAYQPHHAPTEPDGVRSCLLRTLGWCSAEAQAADALAADQLSEPRGKLRVTMPVHFGRHCVTPVLLELARKYPALELDLSFNDRIIDLAEDGYDLSIRTGVLQDGAGLIARRVARQPMIVCASPSYLELHGYPETPEELAQHSAVVYRRSGPVPPWLFPGPGQSSSEVTPLHRFRLDDLDAIADAAARGLGLAWLPSGWCGRRIESARSSASCRSSPPFNMMPCSMLQTTHPAAQIRVARRCLGGAHCRFHDLK